MVDLYDMEGLIDVVCEKFLLVSKFSDDLLVIFGLVEMNFSLEYY